ncbi:MAG: GIY-YIG nuclease family protein [Patescibacteria group bacterium]
MFTVYFLKSRDYPKTYVGSTDNIARRISEHNIRKTIQ